MLTAKDREEIKQLVGAMIADVLARAIEVRSGGLGRLFDLSVTRRQSPF
jgi:hypothetical protein